MSVEAAIDSYIDALKQLSSNLSSDVRSRITDAASAFSGGAPPEADLEFDPKRGEPPEPVSKDPPSVDIASLVPPEPVDLEVPKPITDYFVNSPPQYWAPDPVDMTVNKPPEKGLASAPPAPPVLTVDVNFDLIDSEPDIPTLAEPKVITAQPLSGAPPTVNLGESPPAFDKSFMTEYGNYRRALGNPEADVRNPLWNDAQQLSARLQQILIGAFNGVYALPEDWQAQTHQQQRQDIHSERFAGLEKLDDAPTETAGIIRGRRNAERVNLELGTSQKTLLAASKVAANKREQEVAFTQWAMQTAAELVSSTLSLQSASANYALKGFEVAVSGAEAALDLALRVLEGQKRQVALTSKANDLNIRRLNGYLQIEKSKLAALKVTAASNQVITDYNDFDARLYQAALKIIDLRVRKFQIQIDNETTTKALEQWSLKNFELEVQRYQANLQRSKADIAYETAKIQRDKALTKSELSKISRYQAELKKDAANNNAEMATIKSQLATNQVYLDEYNAHVDALLKELQLYDEAAQMALRALLKGYDNEAQTNVLNLETQLIDDRKKLNEALQDMERDKIDQIIKLKQFALDFSKQQSQGKIMVSAASTTGGAASAAFSALNAVAAKDIVEEA